MLAVIETSSAPVAHALIVGGLVPDVILTDHLLPGMTSTDLAWVLKEQSPTMPVLLNSGHQAERRTFRPTSDLLRTRVSPPQEICYAPEPSCIVPYYDHHSCWIFQMFGIRSGEQY
jgi:CheY-like chemotaxis protein